MTRKGVYTKKRTPLDQARWAIRRRWRWFKGLSKLKKTLVVGGPLLAFLIITPIATYAYYYNDISSQDRLMNSNNTGIVLLDKNGTNFYSSGHAEHRTLIPLDQISDVTEKALLDSEDKDFYQHSAFSFFSIVKAMYANILAGDATAYGGSTLTQQLAKNTLLTNNQTILRKYQELTVATAIEQKYSKDQILDMYLNSVYFGNNSFGIEQAAENYFNKKASDLTLPEASMLIGVLPAPSAYSPVDGSLDLAKQRQNTVLTRMVNNGTITKAQKDEAVATDLTYAPVKSAIDNAAPHFTEMVLNQLYDKYGEEKVKRSGYQVKTTLDLNLQNAAVSSVSKGTPHIQANGGANASLVAIDPANGGILALVGSTDYDNPIFGKVNMATTKRQPGSSFKPIYYADGLANGTITPVTVLKDEKTDFGGGYVPQNADRRFRGDVTVRQALNWSLNIPSIKVMQQVGIDETVNAAKKLGISTLGDADSYGLSLALGSAEVPLTEMTDVYATFANQGEYSPTSNIQSIQDKYDSTIFTSHVKSKRAISTDGAYLISNILSDTATRSVVFGSSLSVTGTDFKSKVAAVKTGTTDDARDAWTIGYTPSIAVGVWVGNNDNTPMLSGGADMAGPIWRNMMKAAIGTTTPSFTQSAGVVKTTICTSSQGIITDVFLTDAIPSSTCATTKPTTVEKQPEKEPDTTTPVDTTPDGSTGDGTGTTTPTTPTTGGGTTTPTTPIVPTTP
ncbi:MAG: PBP1A family penicillin-binding protein [Candidatus Saccharibacteria bacterium]